MSERDLYPSVERWLAERYECIDTFVDKGITYGRIDVSGIRHVGGHLTGASEFVAVEVKTDRQGFGTAVGQAAGYSVYADRCYLAAVRPEGGFDTDELAIAGHLGVGLLHLRRRGRGASVTESLTAPLRQPLPQLRARYIDNLGYAFCAVCDSVFYRGDHRSETWSKNIARGDRKKAVESRKGLAWWLHGLAERQGNDSDVVYHRRYLCSDCVNALL